MNRSTGFYWCKYRGHWGVFKWFNDMQCWFNAGTETTFFNYGFDQIDERKIENTNE